MKSLCGALLTACLSLLAGCGSGANLTDQKLLSITISPSTASAQGGPVQFVATGYYSSPPYTVTPLEANWGIPSSPAQLGTISQGGLAACTKGVSGTTAVEAWVIVDPGPVCACIDSAGRPCCGDVSASAQLTCP